MIKASIPKSGHMILDGPQVMPTAIGIPSDLVLLLRPKSFESWLTFAIHRDMKEREYSFAVSKRENSRKAETVERYFRDVGADVVWVTACIKIDAGTRQSIRYSINGLAVEATA